MKKNKIIKLTACTLLSVTLLTTIAFAQTPDTQTPILISAPIQDALTQNKLVSGTVSDIKMHKDSYTITIENDDMGMVFSVSPHIFIIDQNTKKYTQIEEIKVGTKLTAIIDKMAPMTLSIPPMTSGVAGFILNSDVGSVDLSVYNDKLVNVENTLALKINKDTTIVSENGAKRLYTADDLKQKECLVLYSISTRSIPAQTTPEFVMIMNEKEKTDDYVPLRSFAEEKGYSVSWTANDKPIQLKKENITISISIGKTGFEYTTEENANSAKEMEFAPKLENGVTLVPESFIDSL